MDLSDAYANAAYIPGGAEFPARWAAAAAAFRDAHPPEDIPYGDHPRERLHLFRPEGTARGLLLFVHGGYWRAFSREDYSHLAAGPLARGWAVAMPSYVLCPEATVGGITRAMARALDRAASAVGGPIHLAGHSAGGQVVARLAGADLPLACRGRVARAVPISPLSNLAPLLHTDINEALRLCPEEAAAESPMLRPRPAVPVTVWVGEAERPAFRDQALWLAQAWGAELVVEPGRHHFDVIAGLEQPDHALTRSAVGDGIVPPPSGGPDDAGKFRKVIVASPPQSAGKPPGREDPEAAAPSYPSMTLVLNPSAKGELSMLRSQPARIALRALGLCAALSLAACAAAPVASPTGGNLLESRTVSGYGIVEDSGYTLPAVPAGYLEGVNKRAVVPYRGTAAPGTIEIDPHAKFLYWVQPDGTAVRYPIAVGREGLGISGSFSVNRKAQWPGWTPTANMIRREPEVYGPYRDGVPGGLTSPLGARALYLYRGGRDTFFRIHGTNDLSSIGNSGSAGCIRMFNQDVIDLYNRVPEGTRVVVRSYEESVRIEGPLMANRGVELPPFYTGEGQRPPVPQAMVPERYYGNPSAQGGVAYVPDETDIYGTAQAGPGVEMVGGAGYATARS